MTKKVCCCSSCRKCWTKAIVWVQAIYFICLAVYFVWGLYPFIHEGKEFQIAEENICKIFLGLYVVLVGGLVVGFFMAIVVLRGGCHNEPRQSGAWIVYAIVSFTITAALSIGECFLNSDRGFWVTILAFVVGGCIHGFFIWVMTVHRDEMSHTFATPESSPVKPSLLDCHCDHHNQLDHLDHLEPI